MRRSLSAACRASVVLSLTAMPLTQPTVGGVRTTLRSVRLESTTKDGTIAVVIEASGSLSDPSSERLADPPRIYLDFSDLVAVATLEQAPPNPVVARIRVAEHNSMPLITRIVLDLVKPTPYRIDSSGRAQGRVVVILGAGERPASPTTGSPVARRLPPTASNATAPPAAGVVETQYAARVAASLLRLQELRPLLNAIDRRAETLTENLDAAVKEFDDIAKVLTAINPPAARASTHALLLRTCTMGARAARVRQSTASSWEAASAAAGALIMLDKASLELTQKKVEGRR